MLLDGLGVDRDAPGALDWFVRAAAQHHAMALNMVGRCYDQGWGTGIDKARAAECFRVAAEMDLPEAMYNRATLLALGEGVAEDRPEALALFERAAALGYAKAINHVGSFAEDGWVRPRDMARAAECYARAAEAGDFRGQFNHARMLIAAGDVDAALPWLGRAGAGGTSAFVVKAIAWLRSTGDERLAREGVAAVRDGR
jgi:TPR repeat protein